MSGRVLRVGAFAASAVLGLVAAGCALADADRAALVALGLGLTALAAGGLLTARSLGTALGSVRRDLTRVQVGTESARSRARAVATDLRLLATTVETLPSQVVELQRRYDQLVTVDDPMPGFGSWAATAPTVLTLVDLVLAEPHRETVLECGSGTSTVWLAAAFRKRGHGRVVALEHDPRFAEETRGRLAVHGLEGWATVVDVALADTTSGDGITRPWYALAAATLPDEVDVLFVDGPPGRTSPLARYPAWPLLGARLAAHAVVVLDDTHRAEEREIRDRWLAEPQGGRRLRVTRVVGRSTFFEVVSS